MSIQAKFTEHPANVGETYGQHFVAAMGFSFAMLRGAVCCALHAIFPFLCVDTGSQAIAELHEHMVEKRNRLREQRSAEIAQ
jgi:hypothetical protein